MYVSASSGRKSAISRRRIFVVCQSKRRPKGAVTGSMPPARSTVRLRGCGRITTRCSTPARFSARQRRRKCRSAPPCGAPARACSKRGIERRELLWTGSAGARSRGLGAGCGSRRQTGDTPGQHALAEHHQIEKDEEAEVKLLHLARPIEQHGIRSEEHTSELQSLMRISY